MFSACRYVLECYCAQSEGTNRKKNLKTEDSTLRILICTNAFGMGLDCQGVHTVLHWGPPQDLEAYLRYIALKKVTFYADLTTTGMVLLWIWVRASYETGTMIWSVPVLSYKAQILSP